MSASWTMTDANDTAMTAYIAMRAAQDHHTVSRDQAVAELLLMAGVTQAGTSGVHGFKKSGNRFAP